MLKLIHGHGRKQQFTETIHETPIGRKPAKDTLRVNRFVDCRRSNIERLAT